MDPMFVAVYCFMCILTAVIIGHLDPDYWNTYDIMTTGVCWPLFLVVVIAAFFVVLYDHFYEYYLDWKFGGK